MNLKRFTNKLISPINRFVFRLKDNTVLTSRLVVRKNLENINFCFFNESFLVKQPFRFFYSTFENTQNGEGCYKFRGDRQSRNRKNKNYKSENDKNHEPNNTNRKPSYQELQQMVFVPQILKKHILKILDSQFRLFQGQQQRSVHQITSRSQKIFMFIRSFIILALKLDPKIETMNEVQFDQDYKIDTVKKISQNYFRLIDLLQNQINLRGNMCKYQQKSMKQQEEEDVYFQAHIKLVLVMSQFIILAKALQVAPNQKYFDYQKCFTKIKFWNERYKYFKECLPLGILNPSFRKCHKYLLLIKNNELMLQTLIKDNKHSFKQIIQSLVHLSEENGESSQKNQEQKKQMDFQKLTNYLILYKEDIDQFWTNKSNEEKLTFQNNGDLIFQHKETQPSISNSQKQDNEPIKQNFNKEYILQSRHRKLEVDYRFVQYGLSLYFSSNLVKQHKIDTLNDIRNKTQSQYEQYQYSLDLLKQEQLEKQKGQKKFGKMSRNYRTENHFKTYNKELIAFNFMHYMRANQVYTWLIYRIED